MIRPRFLQLKWARAVFMLALFTQHSAIAVDLSAEERKGRQLYVQGAVANEHEPTAWLGAESMPVAASMVPCVGCHGEDGLGRSEGAVIPLEVTWRHLSKPYGHQHKGRIHPAFSEKSLAIALQQGIDPAGNRLDSSMPRYAFNPQQISALIAYLKRIDNDPVPGVDDNHIQVSTLLPLKGDMAEIGGSMKAMLIAYFNAINEQGGIFNRKLQLQVLETSETPDATLANVKRLINDQQTFAIVGADISGLDQQIAEIMEQARIPLVGPVTLFPQNEATTNRYSFYLFSGIKLQVQALVDFAGQAVETVNPRVAVVYPEDERFLPIVAALERQGQSYRWPTPSKVGVQSGHFDAFATIEHFKQSGINMVFFLAAGGEFTNFMQAARATNWNPYLFLPGSVVQSDVVNTLAEQARQVFMAFPSLPADWSQEGLAEFNWLRQESEFANRHMTSQIAAYCSAKLLVQAIKLAGRQLTRQKLIVALESVQNFETGLSQRLNFGPNRHVGAPGAYVVTIDPVNKQFKPVSDWIVPKAE